MNNPSHKTMLEILNIFTLIVCIFGFWIYIDHNTYVIPTTKGNDVSPVTESTSTFKIIKPF